MKVLIKVEIDENRQWAEANKLYDLLKNYKPVLIPFPTRKEEIGKTLQDISFAVGWNACLEEIMGETE